MKSSTSDGVHLAVAGPVQTRRAVVPLLSPDRGALAWTVFVDCLAAAAGLAAPWLLGKIINDVERGSGAADVDRLAAAVLGFALAQVVLRRWGANLGTRLGERAQARLREQFVDRVLALPPAVVERAGLGDLTARGTGDISQIGATLCGSAPLILVAALQIVFIVVAAFVVNPLLGGFGLVGLAGIYLALRWYLRRARPAYVAAGHARSVLAEQLVASAAGARTIEALGLQERRRAVCAEAVADARRAQEQTLSLRTVLYPSIDVSCVIPVVLVLVLGMVLIEDGLASLGAVVAVALYMLQLSLAIGAILGWIEQTQSTGASLARVEGVSLEVPQSVVNHDAPTPVDDRVEALGVCYAYDVEDGDVLSDVTLRVQPGERLTLVGPSGAGKTTLARLLAGSDRPRAGTITIGGVPITDLSPEQLREQVQFVTQDQHLFRGTIRDNLLLGAPAASDAELHQALEIVSADWVRGLPDGVDTEIGGRLPVTEAQLQQLALARVVLADPHTLVLDEATAQLDGRSARRTERALAALLAGRTIIAVAHRLQTALDADRVVVMFGGRIVEIGAHEELLGNGGAYSALWHTWRGEDTVAEGPGDTLGRGARSRTDGTGEQMRPRDAPA
jgi:ABC-type multidrug transport system fused ATPase/permease subunit